MFGKLELKLKSDYPLSFSMSSLFHGVLMEYMSLEHGDFLHQSMLHPYAQHLERRGADWYWIITALNEEWDQVILQDTLRKIDSFVIKNKNCAVEITDSSYSCVSDETWMDFFYGENASRYHTVRFVTATAFKQQGSYVYYPDIRCTFQSLMNKYDAASISETMTDEETLQELCDHTRIVQYNLRSTVFSLEGVRIPGFTGKIKLKISGPQTMVNFGSLLLRFGEYSGVGIKTALGMGAIQLEKGGITRDRKTD